MRLVRDLSTASLVLGLSIVPVAGPTVVAQEAATLRVAVDGSAEYDTIGEALEAASDGDTILVAPGEYVEGITIDKAITLQGAGSPTDVVITADPREAVLRTDAAGAEYTAGLVVDGVDATIESLSIGLVDGVDAGILLDGAQPTLRDIETDAHVGVNGDTLARIEDSQLGRVILIGPEVRAVVRGNTIDNGVTADTGATGTLEDNIILRNLVYVGADSSLEIVGNTIRPDDGEPAILVGWANASVDVVDNTIESTGPGVIVEHARSARIEGNTITGADTGIIVLETDSIVRENMVIDPADAGIVLEGNGITAEGNTVSGGRVGMVAGVPNGYPPNAPRFDEPLRIIGNTVTDASHFGLLVFDSAPIVSGNSICAGREPLQLEGDADPQLGDNEFCEVDG